jgi:protein SCO1/2
LTGVREMTASRFPGSLVSRGLLVAGCAVLAANAQAAGAAAAMALPSASTVRAPQYSRTVAAYTTPDVALVDQAGRKVALADLLKDDRPVALNFFFASCSAICPVMTSTLSQMRKELGHDGDALRLVSVTIDPDQDTPEVLRGYAKSYSARQGWSFLTGDAARILEVQRAFGADTGGKFNHRLLYFFRAAGSKEWVRMEGQASAADLAAEVRALRPAGPATH